ncbi:HlyD family secretion protein [Hydrogenivirga sp.]
MKSKRALGLVILLVLTAVLLVVGVRWVHYRLTHAITNAVFVESETFTKVAYKRVAGRIVKLYRQEGDRVKKGEALAKIDDRDYRLKLEELQKQIERIGKEMEALRIKAEALREEIRSEVRAVGAQVEAVQKQIDALRVRMSLLKRDRDRFQRLHAEGVVPSRKFEEIDTRLRSLRKDTEALIARKKAILSKRDVLRAKLKQTREIDLRIEALKKHRGALLKKRQDVLNMIEETTLRSPVSGYVVKRFVSEGEVVRQGQFVYAVYDPEDLYVLVLLEETKLEGVEEGNRVYITIDALPGVEYEGIIREINRATAAKFAVIPRDITAGEFTKVAQRIPVKVTITKGDKSLLRVGMGGEVAIELSK